MVAYHRAIQYAVKKGVTVVVSAGNDSRDFNNMQDYGKKGQDPLFGSGEANIFNFLSNDK